MMPETPHSENLFWRWVGATTLGWLLGFFALLALASLADLVGFHGQFMVGVGIGAGVGFLQGRTLSPWVGRPMRWMMATMIGFGGLFVLHDVVRATGAGFPYSLPLYVLVGGLVAGIWQRYLLRGVSERANWWIPISLLAWALPVGGLLLGDGHHAGRLGAIVGLVSMFLGGAIVGAASGKPLVWILRRSAG
jgi:hypothetical protein